MCHLMHEADDFQTLLLTNPIKKAETACVHPVTSLNPESDFAYSSVP